MVHLMWYERPRKHTLRGMPFWTSPRPLVLLAPVLLAALGLSACGADDSGAATRGDALGAAPRTSAAPRGVVVSQAWVRATTGSRSPGMTGAFMVLSNPGPAAVTLLRATTPLAHMTQLHEMTMVNGKSAMHEVAGGIVIPAGGTTVLRPGGYHVMLMKLVTPLVAGEEVSLTLVFSDGTARTVLAPVKAFAEETGGYSPTPAAMPMG